MKRDPYNHQRKYLAWKLATQQGIPGLSAANSAILKRFLDDMERGLNVARGTKKGPRSYIRLNNLRQRLRFVFLSLEKEFQLDCATSITEEQLHAFFGDMRSGRFRRLDGAVYRSTADYVNVFKSFWHWYMKTEKKQGRDIDDICVDLDTSTEKPPWVYITEADLRQLCNEAKYLYRLVMMFLFDSGLRAPTELVNVRISDFSDDFRKLRVQEGVSKTFGRTIRLMLCADLIKEYVRERNLRENDFLFPISPPVANRYLKRLAARVLGQGRSPGGELYSRLSMYDFRHSSACYWLPRYKSESALKYRLGWKNSSMIHYYTEFLGMKDTITEDDMLIDVSKTEVERRLEKSEKDKQLMQERIQAMEEQMTKIVAATEKLVRKAG